MSRDVIGLDEQGRAVIRTRAWSRLLQNGRGELLNGYPVGSAPLKLCEAYSPAPMCWYALVQSSLGAQSSVVLRVTTGTLEGGVPFLHPLSAGPLVGLGPPLAATSIIVEIDPTTVFSADERIAACLSPVWWPSWMVPEDARRIATLAR